MPEVVNILYVGVIKVGDNFYHTPRTILLGFVDAEKSVNLYFLGGAVAT